MKKILFTCAGNAFRSRIAEELFNRYTRDGFVAESAGMAPQPGIAPNVVKALDEIDIPMNQRTPRKFENAMAASAHRTIVFRDPKTASLKLKNSEVWNVDDCNPSDIDCIRERRDRIGKMVLELIDSLGDSRD